ncbi:amidohydrolase [Massilia sp. Dwa41.01b]|uniref:amidohydrolase n=1 Tax=unclassified Massilia TaxID=2609279 RepID=UPI0015FF4E60|nr:MULTISPECIES: amidohydrolase [unclassified Massilia]QNA89958.1 amidohydrolase [Massilia sp. Dwa41.01b]QNB00842.1 amidohydrolase [Massilia sp. Se16.2.3]
MNPSTRLLPLLLAGLGAAGTLQAAALPPEFAAQLDKDYPAIEALYQDLHRNPELAFNEHQTAKKLADRVKALGYEVTTGIGGTGFVAILKNGPGPTAMLRTELDALPVQEKTGLPFASTVTTKNAAGETVPTMHACGHDVHMSAWFATAKLMAENRKAWSGTLMLLGQPAEEPLTGSNAMIKDGLFKRFPKPDYAMSMHDEGTLPAGTVGWHAGHFRASADTITITIHGQGGHGATPQETRDPVVMSARVVMALQTLISRENNPADPVVITVGSIHGGTQANIVPDQVKLLLTVRTFKPEVRKRVLASIVREVEGEAMAAGAPKKPQVDIVPGADSVYNDPQLTARAVAAIQGALGADRVVEMPAKMTSEDFANYGQAGIKSILLHVGAVEPKKLADARAAGKYPPGTHSPQWAPDFKPTVRSFIAAETAVLLDLLKPGQAK